MSLLAYDIPFFCFKDGTATFLARVYDTDGELLEQADVDTITYTVAELDLTDEDYEEPVTGHTDESLSASDVIFDTLQTDDAWSRDATGYNFRHKLDVSTHQAFATRGKYYRVTFTIIDTDGTPILVRFKGRCV